MTDCWAVAQGEYSDYMIHAVFERKEDATEYARLVNLRECEGYHKRYRERKEIRSEWTSREVEKHQGDFADCEECKRRMADHYRSMFVESFPFHPAGEIPHGDAR